MLISDSNIMIMNKIKIISLLLFFFITGCVKEDFDITPDYIVEYEANTSIADLKAMYQGSNVLIDTNIIIKGIVVADDSSGNFYKELYIQDETGAINIRLDESDLYVKFPIGRLVYVKCQNLYLSDYRGVMQIAWGIGADRIPSSYMSDYDVPDISLGGTPVEPKLLTIETLNNEDIGKLIKLENVQFVQGDLTKTYADGTNQIDASTTIEDCDGNELIVRTSGFASFANNTVEQGNGSIIAILSKYNNDYQLKIRTIEELNMTGARCTK